MTGNSGALISGLRVAIAGGAIAGCAAAIELRRLGCEIMVFERSPGQLGPEAPASHLLLNTSTCSRGAT
jgi:2-polyprenyl-6-methoxyphenol hydroxylase-like FAD-dependent oxidoreductase